MIDAPSTVSTPQDQTAGYDRYEETRKRISRAKALGVSANLQDLDLDEIEEFKKKLDEESKKLLPGERDLKIKMALADLQDPDNRDILSREKGRLILEKLVGGPASYGRSAVYGAAIGLLGKDAANAIAGTRTKAAALMHPVVSGATRAGENVAEFIPGAGLAGKAVSGAGKIAGKFLLKEAAAKAAGKALAGKTAKAVGTSAAIMGLTGAGLEAKDQLAGKIIAGKDFEPANIAKEGAENAAIGGAFTGAVEVGKGIKELAQLKRLKNYYGTSVDDMNALIDGSLPTAREKAVEGSLTNAGKMYVYKRTMPGGAIVPESGSIAEKMGDQLLAPSKVSGRPEGVVLDPAAYKILNKAPEIPVTRESGLIAPARSIENPWLRSIALARNWLFSKTAPSSEIMGITRDAQAQRHIINQVAKDASQQVEQLTKDLPDAVKNSVIDAANGAANIGDLPLPLQGLASDAYVLSKHIRDQTLELIRTKTAPEAIKAEIAPAEYFQAQGPGYRKGAYNVFETEKYVPDEKSLDDMATFIQDRTAADALVRKTVKTQLQKKGFNKDYNPSTLDIGGMPLKEQSTLAAAKVMGQYSLKEKLGEMGLGGTTADVMQAEKNLAKAPTAYSEEYHNWLKDALNAFTKQVRNASFPTKEMGAAPERLALAPINKKLIENLTTIPPQMKEYLGQIKDERVLFDLSVNKLADIYTKSYLVNRLANIPGLVMSGEQVSSAKTLGLLPREVAEARTIIPEGLGKISGQTMTGVADRPGIIETIKDKLPGDLRTPSIGDTHHTLLDEVLYGRGVTSINSRQMAFLNAINSNWKSIQTVYNPWTHIRNPVGNVMFAAWSGKIPYFGENGAQAMALTMKAMKSRLYNQPMGEHKYWMEMLENNVVETEFAKQEIEQNASKLFNDKLSKQFLSEFEKDPIKNGAGVFMAKNVSAMKDIALDAPKRLYNIEDQTFKMQHFVRCRLEGMTAKESAADVNFNYPNYAEATPSVEWLRKVPVMGMFITFKAESMRILLNHATMAAEQLGKGNAVPAARFISTASYYNSMRDAVADVSGVTDDEKNTLELNAKPWNRMATYYKDLYSGKVRGIAMSNYFPHGDHLQIFNLLKQGGEGKISNEAMLSGLADNLFSPSDWYVWGLVQKMATGKVKNDEISTLGKNPPFARYSDADLSNLSPEMKAQLGGAWEKRFEGTRLGEGAKMYLQSSTPYNVGSFFAKRFAREISLYNQGQRQLPDIAAIGLGIRFFEPNPIGQQAMEFQGKFYKTPPTPGTDPEQYNKQEAEKFAKKGRDVSRTNQVMREKFPALKEYLPPVGSPLSPAGIEEQSTP